MKRILLSLTLSLLISQGIDAKTYTWQQASSGKFTYRFVPGDPMKARFYTLPNGLTVILSVNKETPRIQTIIATKAGSKTDPKDHTGLAHYLEHMLFKGTNKYGSLNWPMEKVYLDKIDSLYEVYNHTTATEKRTAIYHAIDSISGIAAKYAIANEYDKMTSLIGAKGTNAFTDFEQTAYVNDIPSNRIDQWLTLESERFREPVFRIFHTELEAVYEEKNRGLDNDENKSFELLFNKLFQKHNYGQQTTIGTIEHLKNPSLKAIREYFEKNYVPNNMVLIMAGDLNPDEVIAKIDKSFGSMKNKPVPPYTFEPEAPIQSPIEETVIGPDAEFLSMAFRFPGATSREAMVLELMSNVLSNGNAGLIDLNLVKTQQVLSASAGAYKMKDYSVLFLDGKAKEGQTLASVKNLLLAQIDILKSGQFDESLLKAIINNYKKSMISQLESNTGRAYDLLNAFTTELPWNQRVANLDDMEKLTKKDVQEFCKKWLGNNYVCVYKKTGKDSLTEKVEKPAITPVEVNREAQSDFLQSLSKMPVQDIKPVFVDYQKDIVRATLQQGAQHIPVLSVANKTNSLFTQYYYLQLGSLHNRLLPIAMEYLQYLGTPTYTSAEISKKMYALACDFGVNAGQEESYLTLNGLQENYEEGLRLFEHLLQNCQADKRALRNLIDDIKKRRADEKLNKNAIRTALRYYAQYGARNPYNNQLSNEELDLLDANELVSILHNLCHYPHQVLYYGPKTSLELIPQLSKIHLLPAQFIPIPQITPYTFTAQNNNQVLFTPYEMVQTEIQWFRNGDTYTPDQVPAMNLFNEYFGGSMSGIVFQDIRESKALAYSTYAYCGSPSKKEDPFSVNAYVGCQADKMNEAIAAMQQLLTALPHSEKLFETARSSLRSSVASSRTTKTDIFFSYINAQKKGLNYDLNEKVFASLASISYADIDKYFQRTVSGKAYTLSIVGNADKIDRRNLEKFGPIKTLSLQELFGY